jgi:succinate dehydrogenase/fumarate reductase flavoprotein subunit
VAESEQETYECDALVVGSGCAGMSAAVTAGHHGLNVLIVEKEPRFGGTTARSGGWLWIPGTSLARDWGIVESPDQARTYLRHEAGNSFDAARVDAFLTKGPEAVDFFTSKTALRFDMPLTFPDYHAEAPGGTQGGRSMVTRPFDGHELGPKLKDIGTPLPELTVFGMMLGSGKEIIHFMRATKSLVSAFYVAKRLSRHALDVMRYGRGMTLTNGNALVGRLAKSAFDLNIPLWLSSPVRELIVEDGAVRGAIVERDGKPVRVTAKRGVVLACGGFPHDVIRRKAMFPHAPTGAEHFSPGPTGNTGDGLRLAEAVGGRVEDSLPNAAAWVPVSVTTRKDGSKGVMPHFIDRAKPGVIAVTRDGARFANEGNSYHDFVQEMMKAAKPGEEITAFLLCDHRALRKYGLGCVPPFPMPLGHHLKTGYLKRGETLAELAANAGIDTKGLETTVAKFNETAAGGQDPAFGKGSRAYNRYQGDALNGPNPCIAPIKDGPFYAIKMVIGDLGPMPASKPTRTRARSTAMAGRSRVSMPPATTWPASWAGTIPAPASRSVRR